MRLPWVKSKKTRNITKHIDWSCKFSQFLWAASPVISKPQRKISLFDDQGFWIKIPKQTSLTIYLQTNANKTPLLNNQHPPLPPPTCYVGCHCCQSRTKPWEASKILELLGHTVVVQGVWHKKCCFRNDWSLMVRKWISILILNKFNFKRQKGWWSKWTACVISELRVFIGVFFGWDSFVLEYEKDQ